MNNAILKEIERAGKNQERESDRTNILKDLHALEGINFNNPLFVEKINGKFTANQIEKEINAAGLNSFDASVFLIVKPATKYAWLNGLHLVLLKNNKMVYDLRDYYRNAIQESYKYLKLDTYCRKADIEEARKNAECVYIIAQKKEHTTPAKPTKKADEKTRYTVDYESNNATVLKTQEGEKVKYYAPHRYNEIKTIADIIDKSGYNADIKREALKDKAHKLRAEREKAAYMETDNAETIKELETILKDAKAILTKEIENAGNYEEMRKAEKKADCIKWALYYFDKLRIREKNREYKSIKDFTEAVEDIKEELKKVTEGEKEA